MGRTHMRTRMNKKGQMRIIEVIFASLIVVFALSFVGIFAAVPASTTYEVTNLEKMGYSLLQDLDQNGLLAKFVYIEDWESIRAALSVSLPLDVYFKLTIYDWGRTKVYGTISYSPLGTFETSKNVASVAYSLVGYPIIVGGINSYQATYNPRILILQLARG